MLLGELSHRVKNTLAVVQAIAHQTLRGGGSAEDFIERFDGRLAALAGAHNLLLESEWQGADFATLARNQLDPYTSEAPGRLEIEGAPVTLPPDLATPFGLVLHELATNAAKHGAWSRPEGTVKLRWTVSAGNQPPVMLVSWLERGALPARTAKGAGLGSALIEHAIPHAKVRREFGPEGLVCTIELPLAEAGGDGAVGKGAVEATSPRP
jgi:two-component system CheB/CheR fusion protein